MKNKRFIFFCALIVSLCSGCRVETIKENEERQKRNEELWHSFFVECMELAAKNARAADDDVSDIIKECSNQAIYHVTRIQ